MKIKNKNNQFIARNNSGFSLAWVHLYLMACMTLTLVSAPFLSFFASSITFMIFGIIGIFKIIKIQEHTKIKVTNRFESMVKRYSDIKNRCNQNTEIVDKKIEIQDKTKLSVNYTDNIKILSLQHNI